MHSIRKGMRGAYPEIDRASETEPPGLFVHKKWMSPGYSRAVQGGWTSETDQTPESAKLTLLSHLPKASPNMSETDRLAYKYIYTSTTQSAYEAVPVEDTPSGGFKRYPPTHTLERHADPVGLTNNAKKTLPPANSWCSKERGLTWDFRQLRSDNFNKPRPYTYCSPMLRAGHLPTYSGCVGSDYPDALDNPHELYRPYTVLRNTQPKFGVSGAPRDIPGYTGHRAAEKLAPPAAAGTNGCHLSETSAVHQPMPSTAMVGPSQHARDGELARMVTTVPPMNPFGKQQQQQQ